MKIKMIFSALFFAFFALTNVVTAATNHETSADQLLNVLELDATYDLTDAVLDLEASGEFEIVSCTLKGTLTVTTEDGDSVTIEFKVTGDNCQEVARTFQKIMAAFE